MLRKILLAIAFVLFFCSYAMAVTIDRVDIYNNKRVPEDRIRPYLVVAGSEFDPDVISATVSKLHETGYFLEISVDASVIDNLFVVTYILQETPLVANVQLVGRDKVSEQKILEAIPTKPSEPLNFTHIGTSIKTIQTLYDNEKLFNAKIDYELEYLNETAVNVIFNIEEGEPSRVYNIWFYGNANVSAEELHAVMQTKQKDFWSTMNSSGMLLRDMLEYDRELVRQYYLSQGYATVEVSEAQVDPQADDPSRMNYLLRINEGNRYTVSSVSFTDTLGKFTQDELQGFVQLQAEQYFNATQYRQDILALTNKYTELGYAHANIDPVVQLNHEASTISITYNIEEGEIYTINRIEFTGNDSTRDNVMRREFDIQEGDVYNSALINAGRRNMMVTSFFSDVRISERPAEGNTIDLIVDVDEAKNGSVSFAMSYSKNDGMVGRIEFAQANLFGFGSTLKVFAELQLKGERQDYEVSYSEPWILDRPYSFSISGYSREREYNEYTKQSTGAAFSLGHQPIKRRLYLNYMISQEVVDISNIIDNASQYLLDEAGKTKIVAITPSITYANVNSNLDPSDGFKSTLRLKYAGTFLGGDVDYVKLTSEASYFHPLPYSFVGVLHAEAGQMWSIDDSRLPIDDRFYLGGIYSVRGFGTRDISPKDAHGYSYGGDKYYMMNAELWRPIFEGNISVRGVLFFDMGQVFDVDENFGSASPRMAVGAGVRLFTPMGLLRLEMGYKLRKEQGESPSEIEFAIGNVF